MLEVLSEIKEENKPKISEYLKQHEISIVPNEGDAVFYIDVTLYDGDSYSKVVIENYHTNIVLIEKMEKSCLGPAQVTKTILALQTAVCSMLKT